MSSTKMCMTDEDRCLTDRRLTVFLKSLTIQVAKYVDWNKTGKNNSSYVRKKSSETTTKTLNLSTKSVHLNKV